MIIWRQSSPDEKNIISCAVVFILGFGEIHSLLGSRWSAVLFSSTLRPSCSSMTSENFRQERESQENVLLGQTRPQERTVQKEEFRIMCHRYCALNLCRSAILELDKQFTNSSGDRKRNLHSWSETEFMSLSPVTFFSGWPGCTGHGSQ